MKTLTRNQETHTIAEWSEITGIPSHIIYNRIRKDWSIDKTLSTPYVNKSKMVETLEFDGQIYTVPEWAKLAGMSTSTFRNRLKREISIKKIFDGRTNYVASYVELRRAIQEDIRFISDSEWTFEKEYRLEQFLDTINLTYENDDLLHIRNFALCESYSEKCHSLQSFEKITTGKVKLLCKLEETLENKIIYRKNKLMFAVFGEFIIQFHEINQNENELTYLCIVNQNSHDLYEHEHSNVLICMHITVSQTSNIGYELLKELTNAVPQIKKQKQDLL